jgi:hypothetical protein
MKLRIEVEPQAITQLEELDVWWREHRPDSRTSVLDEFEQVLGALSEQPEIGVAYERGGVRNVRWFAAIWSSWKSAAATPTATSTRAMTKMNRSALACTPPSSAGSERCGPGSGALSTKCSPRCVRDDEAAHRT